MSNLEKLGEQVIAAAAEFKKECESASKNLKLQGATVAIEKSLRLRGVKHPDPNEGCLCNRSSIPAEKLRSYYASIFDSLRSLGLSDEQLRRGLANMDYGQREFLAEGLDPLDPESWVKWRSSLCRNGLHDFAWVAATILLEDASPRSAK